MTCVNAYLVHTSVLHTIFYFIFFTRKSSKVQADTAVFFLYAFRSHVEQCCDLNKTCCWLITSAFYIIINIFVRYCSQPINMWPHCGCFTSGVNQTHTHLVIVTRGHTCGNSTKYERTQINYLFLYLHCMEVLYIKHETSRLLQSLCCWDSAYPSYSKCSMHTMR